MFNTYVHIYSLVRMLKTFLSFNTYIENVLTVKYIMLKIYVSFVKYICWKLCFVYSKYPPRGNEILITSKFRLTCENFELFHTILSVYSKICLFWVFSEVGTVVETLDLQRSTELSDFKFWKKPQATLLISLALLLKIDSNATTIRKFELFYSITFLYL